MRSEATLESLTYQGRIVRTDGVPLEYANVNFLFQITDPAGQCIIYQEQVSGINMTNSGGVFDVPIGAGAVQFPLSSSVLEAFSNSTVFNCADCVASGNSYTCSNSSSTYTPSANDSRRLRVSFDDGTGWKAISPDNIIRSVPYALHAQSAQKLGNNIASDFLAKAGLPVCGTGTFLSWDGTNLTCAGVSGTSGGTVTNVTSANSYLTVATGTTTPVLTVNVGTVANTVAAGNDSRIVNAMQSGTTASGDLSGVYPGPSVVGLRGVSIAAAIPNSGEVLRYNGANWSPSFISMFDLRSTVTGTQSFGGVGCTANQTLTWTAATDNLACTNIAIASSQVSGVFSNGGNSFAADAVLGTNDANKLIFKTNNSNAMTIASNGFIGVGTSTPQMLIHAVATANTPLLTERNDNSDTPKPGVTLKRSRLDAAAPKTNFGSQLAFNLAGFGAGTNVLTHLIAGAWENDQTDDTTSRNSFMSFHTLLGNTIGERVRITSAGRVGIGTTIPSSPLTIYGTLPNASGTQTNSAFYPSTTTTGTNDTYAAQIWNYGVISGSVSNSGSQIALAASSLRNNVATNSNDSGTVATMVAGNISYGHQNVNTAAVPKTTTAYGVKVSPILNSGTITTAYDLHLGTTSGTEGSITTHYGIYQENPSAKNYLAGKTQVAGQPYTGFTGTNVGQLAIVNTGTFAKVSSLDFIGRNNTPISRVGVLEDMSGNSYMYLGTSNSPSSGVTNAAITITPAGYVAIGSGTSPTALFQVNGSALATSWDTSSDIRLKENISALENPLTKIMQLRGVEFDWRKDIQQPTAHEKTHDIGVIAQEVEKVFPEAVNTASDGYKSVSYAKLVAPLIAAVKEIFQGQTLQQREIESLKAENAALKKYLCMKDPSAGFCY
ncbi:tail fiber domain-containing protein [Bdellovibrio sp. NC01]|uniref:tail fiber domain-containing protein n=1 Tax=Bdellovibrio sp. NC01 TaxID=2220073 RepID=UPI00143D0541|nr:tail fiber domain-containing protein [Bdellovibrio sp. NC01]